MTTPNEAMKAVEMSKPDLIELLSDTEIMESWELFMSCGNDHQWQEEPADSVFYKICTKCGGAEGIRLPKGTTL